MERELVVHDDADRNHCVTCGREIPGNGSSAHGIIGLTYAATGKSVVACDEHQAHLQDIKALVIAGEEEPCQPIS